LKILFSPVFSKFAKKRHTLALLRVYTAQLTALEVDQEFGANVFSDILQLYK
jgi:hypothetical protein